jgi:lipopolysaccharide/colanic/teichoic acid biosynthesis glycosyltransferase
MAQAYGRNSLTWEEKFDLDVAYVDHVTFRGDWKIIADTVRTVLKREGISEQGQATMEEFMGNERE